MARVQSMKPTLILGLLLAGAVHIQADVIHLKNGRMVEGEILEHTTQRVAVKLPGGKIVFPTDQVEKIELRRTAKQEYGERVRATDMEDPDALDALSMWASSRGLGDEATALQNMAMGLRLEARIEEVRGSKRVGDFVELFHWARGQNCSDEVLDWLLAQAEGIDAQDYEVLDARRLRTEDLQGRAAQIARREELRRRPRYRMPDLDRSTSEERQQLEAQRGGEGQADDRIAQLEQELEEQRKRIASLEEETARKNRPIIRRRRGRGSNGAITATPDLGVQLLPVPPVVLPPQGGAAPPPPPPPAPRPYTPPSPYIPQVVPPPPVQYPR